MSHKGKFIVFEGLDGSGKTTQLQKLQKRLIENGIKCKTEKEPSEGIIGSIARSAVTMEISLRHESLALLFAADRVEHVMNDIVPQLEVGVNVLCDRFVFSNLAYQSMFLPMDKILSYNEVALNLMSPDLTIFIDTDLSECEKRMQLAQRGQELFEDNNKALLIRENFLKSFELLKGKAVVKIIDGNKSVEQVSDDIWDAVLAIIK